MNHVFDYRVILDRVSHEVPYFRSILKKAFIEGVSVVNNPFNCCAFDNFFNAELGKKVGVNVPKTAVIPTKLHPPGTNSDSMKNLMYPLNWEEIFDYIGFPAYIKSNMAVSGNSTYKVYNPHEFFAAYDFTGTKIMILQESIEYQEFFRCYIIGGKEVRIVRYDPVKPHHHRYSKVPLSIDEKLKTDIETTCKKVVNALGFEFNAVDIAVHKGIPYTIDFLNPVPKLDKAYMAGDDYNWIVNTTAEFLIELAKAKPRKFNNFRLAEFISESIEPEENTKEVKKKK